MLTLVPAKKLGMTSVFDEAGTTLPATVLEPFDLYVLRKKTVAKDGYAALVLAYKGTKDKHLSQPAKGALTKAGIDLALGKSYEIRVKEEDLGLFEAGQVVRPETFLVYWGEATVKGVSKGRGFQGVMRRHNFRGVKMTHGHTIHRKPASNNATDPARVFKGSRRPGRMGNENVTVKNLSVFEYDRLHNIMVLQGTVPGAKGGLVWVKMTRELDKTVVDQQYQVYLDSKAQEELEEAELAAAPVVAAEVERVDAPAVEVSDSEPPADEPGDAPSEPEGGEEA